MKRRSKIRDACLLIILAASVIVAGIGIANKGTYSDEYSSPDFWERAYVAELSEDLSRVSLEHGLDVLPSSGVIVKVRITGPLEVSWHSCVQKADILEVFSDTDGIRVGDTVILTYGRWRVAAKGSEPEPHVERGFINVLLQGTEYLVFCSGIATIETDGTPVLSIFDDGQMFVAPVFAYDDIPNVISTNFYGSYSYVPYADVKDNEFFCRSEAALENLLSLKAEMLKRYS